MKKIITFIVAILLILVGYFVFYEGGGSDEFRLTGEVVQTESYCDGAPPQQPYPVSGPASEKTIHIKEGEVNDLDKDPVETISTDENGSFSASLPSGTYCLIEDKKQSLPSVDEYAPNDMYGLDSQCLEEEWSECDRVVEVSSDTNVDIEYNKRCFWEKECAFCKQENAPCPLPQ